MKDMELALLLLSSLEGCLPDEFVPLRCRECGKIYELEAANFEPLCPKCKLQSLRLCDKDHSWIGSN